MTIANNTAGITAL